MIKGYRVPYNDKNYDIPGVTITYGYVWRNPNEAWVWGSNFESEEHAQEEVDRMNRLDPLTERRAARKVELLFLAKEPEKLHTIVLDGKLSTLSNKEFRVVSHLLAGLEDEG